MNANVFLKSKLISILLSKYKTTIKMHTSRAHLRNFQTWKIHKAGFPFGVLILLNGEPVLPNGVFRPIVLFRAENFSCTGYISNYCFVFWQVKNVLINFNFKKTFLFIFILSNNYLLAFVFLVYFLVALRCFCPQCYNPYFRITHTFLDFQNQLAEKNIKNPFLIPHNPYPFLAENT